MQDKFQYRLGIDLLDMPVKERVAYIKENTLHLTQEMHECLYELPYFKPWKNYSNMTEQDIEEAFNKAREEFIDAWHFFMNIMLALGIDAEVLSTMYEMKHLENNARQDRGYNFRKEETK
jgi:dimeric dUTPase (all-alpha-NTP-PPase superfamily)